MQGRADVSGLVACISCIKQPSPCQFCPLQTGEHIAHSASARHCSHRWRSLGQPGRTWSARWVALFGQPCVRSRGTRRPAGSSEVTAGRFQGPQRPARWCHCWLPQCAAADSHQGSGTSGSICSKEEATHPSQQGWVALQAVTAAGKQAGLCPPVPAALVKATLACCTPTLPACLQSLPLTGLTWDPCTARPVRWPAADSHQL